MSKNAKLEDNDYFDAKLLRRTSFTLKPTYFCILPMAFNWLLALLQRVKINGSRHVNT